jgi:hypothetical protein
LKRVALAFLFFVVGCTTESTSSDRKSAGSSPTDDAGASDAATEAAVADPNDGRDSDPASCYAACQNTSFTCGSLVANLAPDSAGCTGTIGPEGGASSTLKLDCGARNVCIDSACGGGTFSAFTFSYTPAGGAKVICTRD